MIGRGALGNPWIFNLRSSGPLEKRVLVSMEERKRMIHHHFSIIQDHYGESHSTHQIRKHLYWYTKGLPGCASFHSKLSGLKGKEALFEGIHCYFESIPRRELCPLSTSKEGRSVTGQEEMGS
ncbi:MAG: hypothetical protein A2157_08000 [Deltaproteobacteria bacterium RBG_16_47_11]|nr:MAG: hypothetical protein A2157_08000 [Deltaproteobacteria bacterium RBG_16_47_11]